MVSQVRRFNRIVTQRVGALDDRFHGRDRPLGEARLLWEIGPDGSELRALRARVDLDSGYLSRMLRSLERDGLVTVEPGEDKRVRVARLTPDGVEERALLDRRSDEVAAALLEPLTGAQRDRLVGAMRDVERLMTASMVRVEEVDPADPRAQLCLREYGIELGRPLRDGLRPRAHPPRRLPAAERPAAARHARGRAGRVRRAVVPPGASRPTSSACGWRRRRAGSASAGGCSPSWRRRVEGDAVRLETNRALTEAIAMYRSAGYVEIEPFNDERYAHHWFEKRLR